MSSNFDTSELEDFTKLVDGLADAMPQGFEYMLKTVAGRYLSNVIKLSPRVTGTLARGWIAKVRSKNDNQTYPKPSAQEQQSFLAKKDVKHRGSKFSILISNNVEYVQAVNYGHVLKLDKKKGKDKDGATIWVAGQHFVEEAQDELEPMLPQLYPRLFRNWVNEWLAKNWTH